MEERKNHTRDRQTKTIGLIPSPGEPTRKANRLAKKLSTHLEKHVSGSINWEIEIQQNSLIGVAESVKQLLRETVKKRKNNKWDYALCLTDLPLYDGKDVVLADVDFENSAAQLSLPAFGALPIRNRIRRVMVQLIGELFHKEFQDENQEKARAFQGSQSDKSVKKAIRKQFIFSSIKRIYSEDFTDVSDLHFIIRPRLQGNLKVLLGMASANSPLAIMPSFKPVIAVAFATGAYGIIFPTLWKVSTHIEITRLAILMCLAIFSIIFWIIISHSLWEKPTRRNTKGYRRLYNHSTILTLFIAVMFYYLTLYVLFLTTVLLFISPQLFGTMTDIQEVHLSNYFKLSWLAASVATLAGSIGASMEDSEKVQNITYGYRQRMRYQTMENEREKEEEEVERDGRTEKSG